MVRNRYGRRSESTYSRRRLLQASGAGLVGVTGLSTLGSADDDSEIPWNRFHSILADRYNEREADVAVEITEPFAETGVPGLTPPEHELVMSKLYEDEQTPLLTRDIQRYRDVGNVDTPNTPQPGMAGGIVGDLLTLTCNSFDEDWDGGGSNELAIGAGIAESEGRAGYVGAEGTILLFGYVEIDAETWSRFEADDIDEAGMYNGVFDYTANGSLEAGSEADLSVQVYRVQDSGERVALTDEREFASWDGPDDPDDYPDTATTLPFELVPGNEYEISVELDATIAGSDATCITSDGNPTTGEFPRPGTGCEQYIEASLGKIEVVQVDDC